MQSASFSIFIRDLARSQGRAPQLLAYDIDDRSAAEALVSVIAASYRDHGFNPATRTHWFRQGGSLHEIYAWPVA